MTNSDLKKLVTGFLVLAAITSSSVFILSGLFDAPQKSSNEPTTSQANGATVPSNVFSEPIPQKSGAPKDSAAESDDGLPPVSASSNLTERLAQNLTRDLVKTNPSGPIKNPGGELSLNTPDLDSSITKTLSDSNLKLENPTGWNIKISDAEVKIVKNYGAADLQDYSRSFVELLRGGINNPNVINLMRNHDLSADAVNAVSVALDKTTTETKNLSVPAPLLNFHKSFLSLLAYQKNAVAAANSQDPLMGALAIQTEEGNYYQAVSDFKKEVGNLKSIMKDSSLEKDSSFFLADLFEIKPVRAQFAAAVFDVPTEISTALTDTDIVWKWVKEWALQIVKNQLVHKIMQQTINWVQGGGKPQFITNWKSFLDQAGTEAAGLAIQNKLPGLCRSIGPLIKLQLRNAYLSSPPITCTLDQVVQDVKNFYADFNQGGWVGYGALILPSGNYFGSLFEANELIAEETRKKQEAAKSDAQASGGFRSGTVCAERGTSPYADCIGQLDMEASETGEVPDYRRCDALSNDRVCLKTKNVTPGQAVGYAVQNTIGASLHDIVNSQDIVGLVQAFIESGLTKLIQAGQKGLLGLTMKNSITGKEADPGGVVNVPTTQEMNSRFGQETNSRPKDEQIPPPGTTGDIPVDENGHRSDGGGGTGTEPSCTQLGQDEQKYMLPLLKGGTLPQDVAKMTNQRFGLTTGNEAVYYSSNNTIGLPEFYIAGHTNTDPGSPPPGEWNVVSRCGGVTNPGGTAECVSHADVVATAKSELEAKNVSLKDCGAFEITKLVAQKLSGEGATLKVKTSGYNCSGFASDIIKYPNGQLYDILGDSGGKNTPQWLPSGPPCGTAEGPSWTPPPITHAECVKESSGGAVCKKVDGPGSNECLIGSNDCDTVGQTHFACENNACVKVPGSGLDQCGSDEECVNGGGGPIAQKRIVSDATPGFNGGLAYNSTNNSWLVVSSANRNVYGRIMGNNGTTLSDSFQISPTEPNKANGAEDVRAAYSPNGNKYLVVWRHYIDGNFSEIIGKFISSSGGTASKDADVPLASLHDSSTRWTDWITGKLSGLAHKLSSLWEFTKTFAVGSVSGDIKCNGSDGPCAVLPNTNFTISWRSLNANMCAVRPTDWQGTSSSGTGNTDKLASGSRTYNLECWNATEQKVVDTVTVSVQIPAITVDIKANGSDGPVFIPYNSGATLSWISDGATDCELFVNNTSTGYHGATKYVETGNIKTPQSVYRVDCTGPAGSKSDSVIINMQDVTVDIKAKDSTGKDSDGPVAVSYNTGTTLSWTSTSATACSLFVNNAATGVTGTARSNIPTGNIKTPQSVYRVDCTGPAGSASDSVTVNIPVTVDLKANNSDGPVTILYNTEASLSWTSQSATACSLFVNGIATGWTGTSQPNVPTGNITGPQLTYRVDCIGPSGTGSDSVIVKTTSPSLGILVSANGSPGSITIPYNTGATLAWSAQNMTSCSLFVNDNDTGIRGTVRSGVPTGNITIPKSVYRVDCTGPGGSASGSVTVNTTTSGNPPSQGESFVISSGLGGISSTPQVSYDSANKVFAVVWENNSTLYKRTVSTDGSLGALAPLPKSDPRYNGYTPKLAVNPDKNEYCIAYTRRTSASANQVALRKVNAQTGEVGAETVIENSASHDSPSIAYNAKRKTYFVVWKSLTAITKGATITSGCDGSSAISLVDIGANFGAPEVSYNPTSDVYGIFGGHQNDGRNRFATLNSSDGNQIDAYDIFLDYSPKKGNYKPYAIAPNTLDGSFGLGSSKDYGVFRFSPGNGR